MGTCKAITLGAVGLVTLLLLREAGAFDLNLSSSNSESSYTATCSTDAKDPVWSSWSTRIQFEAAEPGASPAVVEAAEGARSADIVVHVDPLDIHGCTWLPLYKWASCTYSARAIRNGKEWGTMEGSIEMNVKGSVPSRYVREKLREEIHTQLSKTVDGWMRPRNRREP